MSSGSIASYGVYNMSVPSKGPKVIKQTIDLQTALTRLVDFTLPIQQGIIDYIQGVYVDNFAGAQVITIQSEITGHTIYVPAASTLFCPLLTANPAQVTFSAPAAAGYIDVLFYNVPVPPLLVK